MIVISAVNIVVMIIALVWVLFSLVWGLTAVYAAVSKKDEREKMIITKSMAQAFVAILFLHMVHLAIRIALGAESYAVWWSNFTSGIYMHPVAICLALLGTFMFINKRRFSAKGE